MSAAIKIERKWEMGNQRVTFNGGVHYIASIIESSKDLEVLEIPMKHLNINGYQLAAGSLRAVVASMKHVLEADMQYPIILDEDGWIIDGRHRVCKALLEGHETIKAVRFEVNPSPAYYENDKSSDSA